VKRIFLPLAIIGMLLLSAAFLLGLMIPPLENILDLERTAKQELSGKIDHHFWIAVGGMLFATLVHGLVMTYFIGTGRWIEETVTTYDLSPDLYVSSRKIKYRIIPLILGAFLLLVVAGSFGASVDPAAGVRYDGFAGLSGVTVHLLLAGAAVTFNAWVNFVEYVALDQNATLIETIMGEVRRVREERGLPV